MIQNGGTLVVAPFPVDDGLTDFEYKSHIGDKSTATSSWIMNNDAVMLYDGPLDGGGSGLDTDGVNSFDLEIGAQAGEGSGRLELHDNSVLRISDDLKVGAEENGNGFVLLDGNAKATIGSGVSLGESSGYGGLEVRGNALLVSGNSADPGRSDEGRTNEGYLTLTQSDVTLSDSAKVYVRSLQHRSAVANVSIEDAAEFHVFDVFENAAPDLGNATVAGSASGPQRTSHVAAQTGGEFNLTIQDDGVFTVDSDLDNSTWSGFAVAGGTNRGANDVGGSAVIEVRDRGSFAVQQDLHLTLGNVDTAESTLSVVGPDASIQVNGNLYFAIDPDGLENFGTATLHSVITANTHSSVTVAGEADISNGLLSVELGGYSPRGGESYTLLQAGDVIGDAFLETDFSLAELPEGLDWELTIDDTSVVLSIAGMLEGLLGDFDNMNGLDVADVDALVAEIQSGGGNSAFDVNGDGVVTTADIPAWLEAKSQADGGAFVSGDTDLNGMVEFADFLQLSGNFGDDGVWSQGNFDGQNGVDFADFLALSSNFGANSAGVESVPEPSGVALAAAAMLGLLSLRKRS